MLVIIFHTFWGKPEHKPLKHIYRYQYRPIPIARGSASPRNLIPSINHNCPFQLPTFYENYLFIYQHRRGQIGAKPLYSTISLHYIIFSDATQSSSYRICLANKENVFTRSWVLTENWLLIRNKAPLYSDHNNKLYMFIQPTWLKSLYKRTDSLLESVPHFWNV